MSNVEKIKKESNYLRGTLEEKSLPNHITGAITDDDQVVLKFHGAYQQDDRDRRDERAEKKLEKLYSFMIRLRIAGGKVLASEWVALNKISNDHANGALKITTRQTLQLHGIYKSKLKPTIQDFEKIGLDSIAACGDVNRNVMASVAIAKSKAYDEVYEISKQISDYLLPKTRAYHEIWLDEEKITQDDKDQEPLYKDVYLPRKFKIVIAIPPHNDVDLYAHDIGFIAVIEGGELLGFNMSIGGGLGATHGNKETFPRLGDVIGFIPKEKVLDASYHTAAIQRDFGERNDRKRSRFKYTIDKYGAEWFKEEFEKRLGFKLGETRDFSLTKRGDEYGWQQDYKGNWHFTLFVENGRVFDKGEEKLQTALLEIAKASLGNFRCTNNQNIIISDILQENKEKVAQILEKYRLSNEKSPMLLDSIACVAFNTCPLAMAEAQRYLPSLIEKIQVILKKYELENDPISIRMTGCPNGCGRPYLAEIGLVGKSYGKYNMMLGGDRLGERLNKLYKEDLDEAAILSELDGLFKEYVVNKEESQTFGDYVFEQKFNN